MLQETNVFFVVFFSQQTLIEIQESDIYIFLNLNVSFIEYKPQFPPSNLI